MKRLIFVVLFFVPLCCFAQHDPRIDLYNEYFQKKDFANALSVADSLIASFPDSMEFHREKAKMLAATDQRDAFFQEMQLIRNASNKDNISAFFSALSHELVKRDFRDELRRFYHAAKDTQILLNWPSFDYEKVVDCKGLVKYEPNDAQAADPLPNENGDLARSSLSPSDPFIDMVKHGVFSIDRSVSIGDAVAGYKFFKQVDWRSFVDVQNRHIVEMSAIFDLDKFSGISCPDLGYSAFPPAIIAKAKQNLGGEITCLIRFAIAKDETSFAINFTGIGVEKRGTPVKEISTKELEIIEPIYKNQPILGIFVLLMTAGLG